MLLKKSGQIALEGMETEPKQKQRPVMDVTGDGSKVGCCEEQECVGIRNVNSVNQSKCRRWQDWTLTS